MKTITLKILAEDIRSSNYTSPTDCCIARALRREGIDGAHNSTAIRYNGNMFKTLPDEINNKVLRMYAHIDSNWDKLAQPNEWGEECALLGTLEPQDFEFEVELDV